MPEALPPWIVEVLKYVGVASLIFIMWFYDSKRSNQQFKDLLAS
jgi:hypothetical protein